MEIEGVSAASSESFDYDLDFHRLTEATVDTPGAGSPYRSELYDHQPTMLGDRVSTTQALTATETRSASYTLEPNSSRLASYERSETGGPDPNWLNIEASYDAAGRPKLYTHYTKHPPYTSWTQWNEMVLDYDESGRLKELSYDSQDPSAVASFVHDHRNQRTSLKLDGTPYASFYHSNDGRLLGELGCDAPGACPYPRPMQEYLWLGGELIGAVTSTMPARGAVTDIARFYVHGGLLGEPRKITRHDKTEAWALDTPPFGRTSEQTPTTTSGDGITMNLGLPGQYYYSFNSWDWHDNWHRMYRSEWGRYGEADPLLSSRFFPSESLYNDSLGEPYSYVGNMPLSFDDWMGLKPGDRFKGKWAQNRAAVDVLDYINPRSIREGREYGGMVCKDTSTGEYFATEPVKGKKASCNPRLSPCPPGTTTVADYHTHGAYDPAYAGERFSGQDKIVNIRCQIDGYLATPSRRYLKFYPKKLKTVQIYP